MEETKGLSERILHEVLATPAVKDTILRSLSGVRPETAAGLARTMLWDDPAVTMSLFAAMPGMINWMLEFTLETGKQFNAVPDPLLKNILTEVGKGVDMEKMGELPAVYGQLAAKIAGGAGTLTPQTGAAMGKMINSGVAQTDRLVQSLSQNRKALTGSLAEIVGNIDLMAIVRLSFRVMQLCVSIAMSVFPAILRALKKR